MVRIVIALAAVVILAGCGRPPSTTVNPAPAAPPPAVLGAMADWEAPRRGSWVRRGTPQPGDLPLAGLTIYYPADAAPTVATAARLLAGDLERITGQPSAVVSGAAPGFGQPGIVLATHGPGEADDQLAGKWEAYRIRTDGNRVLLTGADANGTAFAAYELAERLGVDPLHHWTGYAPERLPNLHLKATDFLRDEPAVRWRGLFHDDEDLLGRPRDDNGFPDGTFGSVATEWYERFFETAARLRMNQVAPYTRIRRRAEINELTNQYGLRYSSHHYDILLSNPWGYRRHGLAEARGVSGDWDWYTNREGMMDYWRAGVAENAHLDCIWPVGLRGTSDKSYVFPPGTPLEEKRRVFEEVIQAQVALLRERVADPVCHLTLYHESLDIFRSGPIDLPPEVILVWNDDGNGLMRALPPDDHYVDRHGVYYHLAFVAWPLGTTIQNWKVVSPDTIAREWTQILHSRAREYLLLNVSELREYVMETRMIADLCWNGLDNSQGATPAERFVDWWSREYFGAAVAGDVAAAYRRYHELVNQPRDTWWASDRVRDVLAHLERRQLGLRSELPAGLADSLRRRNAAFGAVADRLLALEPRLEPAAAQFLFEHLTLPLLVDRHQTSAALALLQDQPNTTAALAELEQQRREIARAERPPFAGWYGGSWVRRKEHATELQRSYRNVATHRRIERARGHYVPARAGDALAPPEAGATLLLHAELTADLPAEPGAAAADVFRLSLGDSLVARGRLNPWQAGFFEVYATPRERGINRAASLGLDEIGRGPAGRASLDLYLSVTNRGGRYLTQATVTDRLTGTTLSTVEESFAPPATDRLPISWTAGPEWRASDMRWAYLVQE